MSSGKRDTVRRRLTSVVWETAWEERAMAARSTSADAESVSGGAGGRAGRTWRLEGVLADFSRLPLLLFGLDVISLHFHALYSITY